MGDISAQQIFSYLKSLKVNADKAQSLSIAIECLESVFEVDSNNSLSKSITNENGNQIPTESSERDKQLAEEFKNKGNESMQAKNYNEAISHYIEAIKLDKTNPVYFSNRSAAYISIQDFDNGLKDAQSAVELDVNFVRAYSRLGVCYFSKGDFENALAAYEKGLELDQGNSTLLQGLEKCKEKLGLTETKTRDQPSSSMSGVPDLSALGGMGGLAEMMKNPQMMQMAQQMMQNNPQLAQMAQQMMGGGQGGI